MYALLQVPTILNLTLKITFPLNTGLEQLREVIYQKTAFHLVQGLINRFKGFKRKWLAKRCLLEQMGLILIGIILVQDNMM
jgi:hypothetical protein